MTEEEFNKVRDFFVSLAEEVWNKEADWDRDTGSYIVKAIESTSWEIYHGS